jgi:hypothetical protein
MVKLVEFLKSQKQGATSSTTTSTPIESPVTPARPQASSDIIDLSQESGAIDKSVMDALIKELRNGRSGVYVSVITRYVVSCMTELDIIDQRDEEAHTHPSEPCDVYRGYASARIHR